MSQVELFEAPPADCVMVRGSWIRHGTRTWTHPGLPGVAVRHCGHPTALRPYYLTGLPINRKFYSLEKAQAAALNPAPFIKEESE